MNMLIAGVKTATKLTTQWGME